MDSDGGDDRAKSVLEPFVDALWSFLGGVGRAYRRGRDRWQRLPAGAKIALWLPFQAILFKAQPILWNGIEYAIFTISRGIIAITSSVARMNTQSQLILLLVSLFALQTTVLSTIFMRMEGHVATTRQSAEAIERRTRRMVSDIDDASERLTDGGARSDDRDREETVRGTTGTGAIGGAIGIGALGAALGGPAGGIGGAVLGFILGEEFEKRTVPPHLRPRSRRGGP